MIGKITRRGAGWAIARVGAQVVFLPPQRGACPPSEGEYVWMENLERSPKGPRATFWLDIESAAAAGKADAVDLLKEKELEGAQKILAATAAAAARMQRAANAAEARQISLPRVPSPAEFSSAEARRLVEQAAALVDAANNRFMALCRAEQFVDAASVWAYARAHAGRDFEWAMPIFEGLVTVGRDWALPHLEECRRLAQIGARFDAELAQIKVLSRPRTPEWAPSREQLRSIESAISDATGVHAHAEWLEDKKTIKLTSKALGKPCEYGAWEECWGGGEDSEEEGASFAHSLNVSNGLIPTFKWSELGFQKFVAPLVAEREAALKAYYSAVKARLDSEQAARAAARQKLLAEGVAEADLDRVCPE